MPESIALYEPGEDITGRCTAAVVGRRFVKISGNRGSNAVSDSVVGGNVPIAHADAAGRIFGVAAYDGAIGAGVGVKRAAKLVTEVDAGAAIAAFEEVEVGATGKAVPLAAGKAVGFAIADAANATVAQICLY